MVVGLQAPQAQSGSIEKRFNAPPVQLDAPRAH